MKNEEVDLTEEERKVLEIFKEWGLDFMRSSIDNKTIIQEICKIFYVNKIEKKENIEN